MSRLREAGRLYGTQLGRKNRFRRRQRRLPALSECKNFGAQLERDFAPAILALNPSGGAAAMEAGARPTKCMGAQNLVKIAKARDVYPKWTSRSVAKTSSTVFTSNRRQALHLPKATPSPNGDGKPIYDVSAPDERAKRVGDQSLVDCLTSAATRVENGRSLRENGSGAPFLTFVSFGACAQAGCCMKYGR